MDQHANADFLIDFRDVDLAGNATALLGLASHPERIQPGAHVIVTDDAGTFCRATVRRIGDDGIVMLTLNPNTVWRTS